MKIARVETIRVQEFAHALWVQVHTDSGLVGLGLGRACARRSGSGRTLPWP